MAAHPAWLAGFTDSTDEPAPPVPILLLDAFALERVGATAIRCAVIGCVGGELRLAPKSHLFHLPKLLIEAWQQIATRPLRSVRAEDFVLCAMDVFSASATGWQMWLRAMVHVRVADQAVHLEPLQSHGAVTVSAAVAQVAVRRSAAEAFDNPRAAREVTHHWWLPTLKRRILAALGAGETRNDLSRATAHGGKGEVRKHYKAGMENQLGALGFVVNTIVLWNTLYMGRVWRCSRRWGMTCYRRMSLGYRR